METSDLRSETIGLQIEVRMSRYQGMRPRVILFQQAVMLLVSAKNWGKQVARSPGNELKEGLFQGHSFCRDEG